MYGEGVAGSANKCVMGEAQEGIGAWPSSVVSPTFSWPPSIISGMS